MPVHHWRKCRKRGSDDDRDEKDRGRREDRGVTLDSGATSHTLNRSAVEGFFFFRNTNTAKAGEFIVASGKVNGADLSDVG